MQNEQLEASRVDAVAEGSNVRADIALLKILRDQVPLAQPKVIWAVMFLPSQF